MATTGRIWRGLGHALAFGALMTTGAAYAQLAPVLWEAAKHFQYNIEKVDVRPAATPPGSYDVKVVFSVTDPEMGDAPWNIKSAPAFQSAAAQLTIDVAWDPGLVADFTNTGSNGGQLTPIATPSPLSGIGAALPVQKRSLTSASGTTANNAMPCLSVDDCGTVLEGRYFAVTRVVPLTFVTPVTRGRVALEGRPVCNSVPGITCPAGVVPPPPATPVPVYSSIPARSATASFTFAPTGPFGAIVPDQRRAIVDIAKCKQCHDDTDHGTGIVPRLSLHGANRNENLGLCVMCHNANQTDVPYRRPVAAGEDARIAGPEVPIDFKTMVHSIHAGGFRDLPFAVVGRNSVVIDFSDVRFPRELRDCSNCHVDVNGKGTYELPLRAGVLGTTIRTQSRYVETPRSVDVDPADDLKISPTAAVCSSCHDKAEVRSHMVRKGGASFATKQAAIGTTVRERCASCHGPGKDKDVRKVHEVGRSGTEERHDEHDD